MQATLSSDRRSFSSAPARAEPRGPDDWLDVFRQNAAREPACGGHDVDRLSPAMRGALARSLGIFYLGEAGEGRIIGEVQRSSDPAFGPAVAGAIRLYIREEWRHAAELRSILAHLGAAPARHSWSEVAFRRGRRLLGLRLKILAIGAAEVAGVVYYSLLAERIDAPSVADVAGRIAREEQAHLEFVRDLLARAASEHPVVSAAVDRAVLTAVFTAVALCGALAVCLGHGELLRLLGASEARFFLRCLDVLRQSQRR